MGRSADGVGEVKVDLPRWKCIQVRSGSRVLPRGLELTALSSRIFGNNKNLRTVDIILNKWLKL